jgi:FlaA1/EpsC-like NDP-sugar epimerase
MLTRRALLAAADACLVSVSLIGAIELTATGSGRDIDLASAISLVALATVTKCSGMAFSGVYSVDWRRLTSMDLFRLLRALLAGSALFLALAVSANIVSWIEWLPARVLILDFLLCALAVFAFRAVLRLSLDLSRPRRVTLSTARTILIVGAGDAGMQVARALREEAGKGYRALGFIDDDPRKRGLAIHGLRVLGSRADMGRLAKELRPDELWIAMPSASGAVIRDTVDRATQAGLKQVKLAPGNSVLLTGQVSIKDFHAVPLEELLGRDPVRIDNVRVREFVIGRSVLVTGAVGSIGSEICRQLGLLEPSALVILDQDESGIFNLDHELVSRFPKIVVHKVVGDIRDAAQVEGVFRRFHPQLVFHAAAYKHVPLMEEHPAQAVRTNTLGTKIVAEAARAWGAQKFVLISTDKAVNPASIMGATKRAAEVIIGDIGSDSATEFVAVRFGNVLGSRGSVVPLFREQIANGGPVTVTHPEMKRYFMTIPEAVVLVFQAAAIGANGQVLVLDMGAPVKIVDLARQVIKLSGLEPDRDIPIVFTGIRPGEKLFEDILTGEEGTTATEHERVFVAVATRELKGPRLKLCLAALSDAVASGKTEDIVEALRAIVPTYNLPTAAAAAQQPALQVVAD